MGGIMVSTDKNKCVVLVNLRLRLYHSVLVPGTTVGTVVHTMYSSTV